MADPTFLGILVDVSDSMRTSLRNNSRGSVDRLDGWAEALARAATRAAKNEPGRHQRFRAKNAIRVFAYAFGTRKIGSVADLLTMLTLHADSGDSDAPALGVTMPASGTHADPYTALRLLALNAKREGWGQWIEDNLNPAQAEMLLANLRDSPRLRTEVSRMLPPLSTNEYAIARSQSHGTLGLRAGLASGTGGMKDTAKLAAKASFSGYKEKVAKARPLIDKLTSRRMTVDELIGDLLDSAGSTTLTVDGLASLLTQQAQRGKIGTAFSEYLYGSTPLTAAVERAERRFGAEMNVRRPPQRLTPPPRQVHDPWTRQRPTQDDNSGGALGFLVDAAVVGGKIGWTLWRESRKSSSEPSPPPPPTLEPGTNRVLFILSDGESTDGDPSGTLARLHGAGVTVVCCYVGATDIVDHARRLPTTASPSWELGARQMFGYASPVPDGIYRDYLREKGWAIPDGSRMFFQANHSDVLAHIAELIMR